MFVVVVVVVVAVAVPVIFILCLSVIKTLKEVREINIKLQEGME